MKDIQHNGQKIPKVQSEAVNQWRIYNTMNKRYQRCNQKPYINEGHTTQWAKDTKDAIRSRKSMKDITASDCTFGIFCSLCCISFIDLRLLIAPLVSFAYCVVYPSLIYGFWLHLWYLLPIVLSILHWFTASDCTFGIFCPLCCLSFIDLRLLIAPLVSFVHCVVYPSLIYCVNQWRIDNTMNKRYQRCNQKP
jgi:hypothetical protein